MSIEMFLERENIQLIWDVLIDEPMIKKICTSQNKVNELVSIFENNLKAFYSREKLTSNSLVDLNKKYILLLINYVIKLQTQQVQSGQPSQSLASSPSNFKKIKIHHDSDTLQQQITYEDIHNERITKFEKELNKKQEEFTSAMVLPVPPVPNFNDNMDEPISEIELEIKKIQEQRNYDIEMISKSYNVANNANNTTGLKSSSNVTWLTSQETSIKNEKLNLDFQIIAPGSANTDTNDKHITWSKENQFYDPVKEYNISSDETNDLFKKLKKVDAINYQPQIDELKNDLASLHSKINAILEKMNM
jgi:hypothetical protein